MYRDAVSYHSNALGEDLGIIVLGEKGYPVIVFQTQGSKCTDYESFGMVDELASFIDAGEVQLFSVDSRDSESWTSESPDLGWRAQRQEDYFRFVCDELVPYVHERNGSELRPLTTGCALGATHAAICAMRRPDLFQGCIALSGTYRTSAFFGDWMDENLFMNDMVEMLHNLPADHPYIGLYQHRQLVFCVGQGAWEDGIDDLRDMDANFKRLGIPAWCDFWGFDVNHDWPWWKKQMRYFLPIVLEDVKRELAAEAPSPAPEKAEAPAAEKAAPKAAPAAKPAPAEEPKAAPAAPKKAAPATKEAAKPKAKAAAAKPASKAQAAPAKTQEAKPAAEPAPAAKTAEKAAPVAKPEAKAAPAAKPEAKPDASKASATAAAATHAAPKAKPAAAKPAATASKAAPADAKAPKAAKTTVSAAKKTAARSASRRGKGRRA